MKTGRFDTFPRLRRSYDTAEALGGIINKGRRSVLRKLKGDQRFTPTEQGLIIDDLIRRGLETDKEPETFEKYFGVTE